MIALAAGIAVALLGLVAPPLRFLYDYSWFVGFATGAGAYLGLMWCLPAPSEMPEAESEAGGP